MPLYYTEYDLRQNTPEWMEWRNSGLGASDASTILGMNPWKTREDLLKSKRGTGGEFVESEAMRKGHAYEPLARASFIRITGERVRPVCLRSLRWEWLLASMDGMTFDRIQGVEIKCGESCYRHVFDYSRPPAYYVPQLQQQMAVANLNWIWFFAWYPQRKPLALKIDRNDSMIRRIVQETRQFWDELS